MKSVSVFVFIVACNDAFGGDGGHAIKTESRGEWTLKLSAS